MSEFPLLCIRGDECSDRGPRQTDQRGWFCPECVKRARGALDLIADSWDDLGRALTPEVGAMRERHGKVKRGGKTHGLNLSDPAVEARTVVREVLRFMVRELMDAYDEDGRALVMPDRNHVPTVARWLANRHVEHFTSHDSDHLALEVWDDLERARRLVVRGAYPLGASRIDLGFPCEQHGTSDQGERVPCDGTLYAVMARRSDRYPDLLCTTDPDHVVATSEWLAGSWRRRHLRDMDEGATTRLLASLGLRHTVG